MSCKNTLTRLSVFCFCCSIVVSVVAVLSFKWHSCRLVTWQHLITADTNSTFVFGKINQCKITD